MNQLAELHLCLTDKRDLNILKAAIQTAFTRMHFQAANTSEDDLHWPMVEAARLSGTDGSMLRLPIWITLELKPGVKTHQLDIDAQLQLLPLRAFSSRHRLRRQVLRFSRLAGLDAEQLQPLLHRQRQAQAKGFSILLIGLALVLALLFIAST